MSDSTLGATIGSVKGAVESGIASITGSTGDEQKAQEQKDKAAAENEASHSVAKVGPFNATPSGVSQDSQARSQAQWDQTAGSARETIGGIIGSENLKAQGRQQREDGEAREAAGQLNDAGQGVLDRAAGTLGGAAAGLTGDREKQKEYQDQHDQGKATLRGVQAELQKKADAAAEQNKKSAE